MAELTPQERLQPALLDRLTDEEPENRHETREQRVMSKNRLRQAVLRDLVWLLNATRLEADERLNRLPHVRHSVVNFGMPPLSGSALSSLDLQALERSIREAIEDFEPRVLRESLQVRALVDNTDLNRHNVIGIEIRGQLWAEPVPLELLVRTEIDLETGQVELSDLVSSRAV